MVKSTFRSLMALAVLGTFSLRVLGVVSEGLASEPVELAQNTTISEQLLSESKDKQFDCKQFVTRIDEEIDKLDKSLTAETVANEAALLEQRATLVNLRLDQPCHSEVVQVLEPIPDEQFCQECVVEEVVVEEIVPSGGYGACCSGGYGGGGGGGGGGGAGGGGMGWLGLAGLAGLAGLDNNNGGGVVVVSL